MNHKMLNRTFPEPNNEVSTTSPSSNVSFLHAGWWFASLRSCAERWLHFNPDQQLADKEASREDEKWKAEQEKQRKEQAIANATGLRVLSAVSAAVLVRLMKRDLLFILEKLVILMNERRIETLARQHGIRQKRDEGGLAKTFGAFLRRSDEGTLSRLMVESAILLAAVKTNPATVLRDAATAYKVNTDAIALKVKQEFAAKDKAKKASPQTAKPSKKAA